MGFFLTFLVYAVLFVLSDLLRPKPELENAKPAGLGDFRVTTATEGRPVPLFWGTVRFDGPNVVWYGDLLQQAIKEKVKTGLFTSQTVVRGYRYYLGVQWVVGMGDADEWRRLWIGDDLIFDGSPGGPDSPISHGGTLAINEPNLFGGEELGQGGVVGTVEFFAGTNTQSVSTYLSGFQKEPAVTGDTPAYRDVCYFAPSVDPILFGTSTQLKQWNFELTRLPNGLALTGGKEDVNDGDANPAAVLYELLTNTDWGYGFATASIDAANLRTAGDTLYTEGNGFSFLLDRVEDKGDLLRRLEEQVDGILYQDPTDGLWKLSLIRDDYNILTVPEINSTNLRDLRSFTRGTWEGTTNQVRVPFFDREDSYKSTYGFAQDMANVRILGSNVSSTIQHPGVKNAALANSIAWRELRTLSLPLAKGTFIVDRSLYGVMPGDVVGFTDPDLDYDRLPIRVQSVDYGELLDGKIVIVGVQDVFQAAAGVFANAPNTGWVAPSATLVDYPADERVVFEAPRAFTLRDPGSTSPEIDKVFAAARRQGSEVVFEMRERNAAGTPAGAYTAEFGQVYDFMLIGELDSALPLGATNPVTSVDVVPDPDTQAAVAAAFPDVPDLVELGTELVSLCLIDEEFILVESAQTSGGNVQLNNVHRGVLDSVQADHSSGAKVYLLFVAGGMSDRTVLAGNNVDVLLIPKAAKSELAEGSATATSFQMDDRTRRPYPPVAFDLNGTTLDTTNVDLDGSGSGEDVGVLVDEIVRRDFRTVDEIEALTDDAANLFADFPSANSTEVEVEARNGGTALTTETGISGTSATVRQLDVLAGLDTTSLPSSLSIAVRESHTLGGTVYGSRSWLVCTFTVVSAFVGKHAFGELDDSEITSNAFVVVAPSVDHVFNLSTSFTTGDVEYRINGGSWLTLISAGGTGPGTIPNASLSASDTIEVRHLSTDTAPQKLLTMTVSGTEEAYAVLIS